jgi:Sigma-70, region 4
MASLDSLPPDQRAVLDLVLRRGRSYDDIAQLLAIDRAAVRARALEAFDGIGPDTGLPPEARALITDYLLGQLPDKVAEQTRDRLAESPYERAWARVLASELSSVAAEPLPEIPEGTARSRASASPGAGAAEDQQPRPTPVDEPRSRARTERRPRARPEGEPGRRLPRPSDRPTSRLGGAIFLLVGTVVVILVVVVLLVVLSSGGSNKHSSTAPAASVPTSTPSTTPATGTTTGTGTSTGTSTTKPKVLGQANMSPPSGSGAAKGAALIVQEGNAIGVILEASGLAPNSHNAYAVWLSNAPTDSVRVGFVNQSVGKNGRLETGGALPAGYARYKDILLTLETQNNPKTPGPIVLEGAIKLASG